MEPLIDQLKKEPSLAWKLAVGVLGAPADSTEAKKAAGEVFRSPLAARLLEGIGTGGSQQHVYSKWTGAHWVLSLLADLGCPGGQDSLKPRFLRPHQDNQVGRQHLCRRAEDQMDRGYQTSRFTQTLFQVRRN